MLNGIKQVIKSLTPQTLRPRAVAERMWRRLETNSIVVSGPFAGLNYPWQSVGSVHLPKLMGVYELELAPILHRFRDGDFATVIVVGAAEGYYALGCARLWPSTRVIAYETDPQGRKLIMDYATRNRVVSRIDCRGNCSASEFASVLQQVKKGFVIMDIEGGEDVLLNCNNVPAVAHFHVLVELHTEQVKNLAESLRQRFEATHTIEEIWTRRRDFRSFSYPENPLLRLYLLEQLRDAADELRDIPMRWFMMTPRENVGA